MKYTNMPDGPEMELLRLYVQQDLETMNEELEREGFLYSITGKGSFVAGKNAEFLKEEQLRQVEEHLTQAVHGAQLCGMELEELLETLRLLWKDS